MSVLTGIVYIVQLKKSLSCKVFETVVIPISEYATFFCFSKWEITGLLNLSNWEMDA